MTGPAIVGHTAVRALLARAVAGHTLPHSLIFDGPDGVGKRACALQLAAAINCVDRTDGASCGVCGVCRRIARGAHPDVVLVTPNEKGTITVDMARDVIASASYRPFEARRRVVIIDDADVLQAGAQNALLKTLEEPPPSSMFILVTARVDALLVTVRSRCPRFRFGRLATEEVAQVLTNRGVKADAALALAAVADGSVARALAADAGELDEARRVALAVLQGLAARPSPAVRLRMAQHLVESQSKKKSGASERDLLGRRLDALSMLLRDVGGVAAQASPRTLMSPDLVKPLGEVSRHFDGPRLVEAFHLVDRARRAVERNQSAKVVADWLACEM